MTDDIVVRQNYVVFYSPGTMLHEQREVEIDSWDVDKAVEMSLSITERHGAFPFGFRFIERGRAATELDSKQLRKSCMYYMGGKIRTKEEVFADNLPDEEILRGNMERNNIDRVHQTIVGWKSTNALNPDDIVLPNNPRETADGVQAD